MNGRWSADGVEEYREVYWRDRASEIPAIRDQLASLKLTATYATFTTLYNRDPEREKQLMRDLEDAHALGGSLMRVFPGERPGNSADASSIRAADIDFANYLGNGYDPVAAIRQLAPG